MKTSIFDKHRDTLEHHETMMGTARGRLAVALDLLTDSLALVGQHGVYCRSERFPGQPRMDIALVLEQLDDAKQLVQSAMEELRSSPALARRHMIDTLGQYKILEPAGSGALGDVYRARDTRVGRTVAITVVSDRIASNPGAPRTFSPGRPRGGRRIAPEHRDAL